MRALQYEHPGQHTLQSAGAHWIQESTWIDIHLSSLTGQKSPRQCRATLMRLLDQIRVENTNNTL